MGEDDGDGWRLERDDREYLGATDSEFSVGGKYSCTNLTNTLFFVLIL